LARMGAAVGFDGDDFLQCQVFQRRLDMIAVGVQGVDNLGVHQSGAGGQQTLLGRNSFAS
jgi:hypothetical protein